LRIGGWFGAGRRKYRLSPELKNKFGKELGRLLKRAGESALGEPVVVESLERTASIIEGLTAFQTHRLPEGKGQTGRLKEHLFDSLVGSDLIDIYAGSCPDFSHKDGLYTHEGVGDGLPLLSKVHVDLDVPLAEHLTENGVKCRYILMLADVEAMDEVFCQRFTDGNQLEFLARCRRSMEATSGYLKQAGSKIEARASSFFDEFGQERFMDRQREYEETLAVKYGQDASFRMRVTGDTSKRIKMYDHMYPRGLVVDSGDRVLFLERRTIRTMAQYRVLADLIGEKSRHSVIINHPTVNTGVYNEHRLALDPQKARTIPVIIMDRRVY